MRLIIVDGLDGVGKDTHAYLIKKRYEAKGERVLIRSHPESDTFFGRQTKKALLGIGKIAKLKASIFYALDVLSSIRKYYHSENYDTLIMVRYLVGTAYLPFSLARIACNVFEKFVPISDYMLFLDASPTELERRVTQRTEKEIFETYESLVAVRKKALALVSNWHIIDTTASIPQTFARIEQILEKLDTEVSR